jgi:hypothetical protein
MIVLVLLGVFLLAHILKKAADKPPVEEAPKSDCPPHKWSYHPVTDKLTCTACNFEAGSYNRNGEY